MSAGRSHRPSASQDGTTGEPARSGATAGRQMAIGSDVLLGGCAALYLGRTATGGYAFAVGARVGPIGRRPVFVTRTLANVVRSTMRRPPARRGRTRRRRSPRRPA